jgi:PAS domain S-box-containing protein
LFERFHRVIGARGRSYEGSGIGLALVQELVRLHGGAIAVESDVDKGTTFGIRLPFGKLHLPAEHIGATRELTSTAVRSEAFVQEALRWHAGDRFQSTPESPDSAFYSAAAKNAESGNTTEPEAGGKVLVVDDNADMREYVQTLLAHRHVVLTATNGEEGYKIARVEQPNLILTDIMMPGMDGFALLRALRADDATREIPVIFLSARAGEEATIEGRLAGADDYLVKPFSARELLARVGAHLKLAQARKNADARVRENEERFRALVTATSDVIYRMSPDWSEMAQLQGKDFLADTAGASNTWLAKYIHPDDQADVLKTIREAIQAKQVFELEHRVFRADGTLGWTLSRAVPMMDDDENVVEWFGAASDVTATKQAQESLRQSLAIVDSADDAIVSKDLNGIVRTWNQGAVRMFGYTSDEMVGQPILRLIPEELHYEEDDILHKLRAGDRIDHYDTVRMKKGGGRIEVSVTISPIRDASGRVIGASKIARDISDRKRIERLLVQSEKLAATGRMAAAVAHEINNPLESLINLIYLARKNSPPEGKAYAHLQTAEHELERIAHIARQTLGYYRDTGLPTDVHLRELIENVLTVYKAKLVANEITIEARFNDIQKISVSRGELLQVFSNIITNAIDAMPRGGTLNIATSKIAGPTGEGIQTVIRDSGVGIEQEHLERIFEPFFTTKGNVGTGIGLWIARQLAERRGGQISVASSTERGSSGTSVTIFIPFAAPVPQSSTVN